MNDDDALVANRRRRGAEIRRFRRGRLLPEESTIAGVERRGNSADPDREQLGLVKEWRGFRADTVLRRGVGRRIRRRIAGVPTLRSTRGVERRQDFLSAATSERV